MAATTAQLVAHVLRRTTFGPYPGQVEAYVRKGPEKTIAAMLARDPLPTSNPPDLTNDDSSEPVQVVADPDGQPSCRRAREDDLVLARRRAHQPQQGLLVAGGVAGTQSSCAATPWATTAPFLKKITVTPAMLVYLDGSWSTVQGPNENYARELQELFTIGQERVTETNVQHAALALAGWHADYDTAQGGLHR